MEHRSRAMAFFRTTFFVVALAAVITGIQAQNKDCSYKITIKTKCDQFAGTNAKIDLRIFDKKGKGRWFYNLRNGATDHFERCSTDVFTFEISRQELVIPCGITLASDDSGFGAAWLPDYVIVSYSCKSPKLGGAPIFYQHNWIPPSRTVQHCGTP